MDFITNHPVLVVSLVKIALLLFIVLTALAYLTWFERKLIAHIQSRWGPTEVGAHGLLQPLADGVKFLFKEDLTPPGADQFLYILAPFLAMVPALSAVTVVPFGAYLDPAGSIVPLVLANVDVGLLALPALWWLLRAIPPAPRRQVMTKPPDTTTLPAHLRPLTVDIPGTWTPEEALAVFGLIDDLRDKVWTLYSDQLQSRLREQCAHHHADGRDDAIDAHPL